MRERAEIEKVIALMKAEYNAAQQGTAQHLAAGTVWETLEWVLNDHETNLGQAIALIEEKQRLTESARKVILN